MDEKEILREAITLSGTNMTELSVKLGYTTPSGIGNIFQRNSMRVDILVKLLDAMGYDLIVRGHETVKAPGGADYIPEWKVTTKGNSK